MNTGNMQTSEQQEWADAKRDELYNMLCGIDLTGERYLTLSSILSTFRQADTHVATGPSDRSSSRHGGLRLITPTSY